MYEFFELSQCTKVQDYYSLSSNMSIDKVFADDDISLLDVKAKAHAQNACFLPLIENPAWLISKEMLSIFQANQIGLEYKLCALRAPNMNIEMYYALKPPIIECMSTKTKKDKMGNLIHLVLKKDQVGFHRVFGVKGLIKKCLFAHISVAELLLQRGIYPVTIAPVECE